MWLKKSPFTRVLCISDNVFITNQLAALWQSKIDKNRASLEFAYTSKKSPCINLGGFPFSIKYYPPKYNSHNISVNYDLVISAHSKQLFPSELVNSTLCVNLHPGLNPYNRGWFPQVFSIINGLPLGATLHVIDEQIDHGPIIDQEIIDVYSWDTSLTAYSRVLEAEILLLERNLEVLISGDFTTDKPTNEGNLNFKADFEQLCELDLAKEMTLKESINLLRALTHGDYKNAYFSDPETNTKVFVSIDLIPEKEGL
jgi:methionyl-tRNA formyltransferase